MSDWGRWMRHSLGAGCTAFGVWVAIFAWWRQLGLNGGRAIGGPPHVANWYFGWLLLGVAFLSGAVLAISFFEDDFLSGYSAFRRRAVRLGHVSLAAMGLLNVLYGISPLPEPYSASASMAGMFFVLGGALLPALFFLAAWQPVFRLALGLPVFMLSIAVLFTVQKENEKPSARLHDPSEGLLKADLTQFRSILFNPDLYKALPHPKRVKSEPKPAAEQPDAAPEK